MRRLTMLASLLMVLCLQMAAQTWEEVKVGTSTRKTLTYVPKNVEKSPALVISQPGIFRDGVPTGMVQAIILPTMLTSLLASLSHR